MIHLRSHSLFAIRIMFTPTCCSDLGCTSNYHPFHRVPSKFRMYDKLPLKQIWKRALSYKNIDNLKVYNVRIKHFRDEDVELLHKVPNGDGTFTEIHTSWKT